MSDISDSESSFQLYDIDNGELSDIRKKMG